PGAPCGFSSTASRHTSSIVRSGRSRAMNVYASRRSRKNWLLNGSCNTYHRSPRNTCRRTPTRGRRVTTWLATRYHTSLNVPRVSLMTVSPPPEPEIIQRATRRLPDGGTTPCRDLSDATHAGPPPALAILGKNAAHEENVPLGPRLGQRLHPLDLNGKPASGMTREHELGPRLRLHETHVR